MTPEEYDLKPVSKITAGAIGPQGQRVFYLQARKEDDLVTLIVEKQQVQSLAIGLEQFLADLDERFPDLSNAEAIFIEGEMELEKPIDPVFRVGKLHNPTSF